MAAEQPDQDLAEAAPPSEEEAEELEVVSASSEVDLSTELPVVVIGAGEGASDAPIERLLPGRVDPRLVFLPIYLVLIFSGQLAANAALDTGEWSMLVVVMAWAVAYLWTWLYRVAWTYRRRFFQLFAFTFAFGMALGLAFFCYDKAEAQMAIVQGEMQRRSALASLWWAGHLLLLAALVQAIHLVFLGRGYRRKPEALAASTEA